MFEGKRFRLGLGLPTKVSMHLAWILIAGNAERERELVHNLRKRDEIPPLPQNVFVTAGL